MLKPQLPEKKFGQKTLKVIRKELIKELSKNALEAPYDLNSSMEEFRDVLSKFGITNIDIEDYGFWSKLVTLNYATKDEDNLIIPKASRYSVEISEDIRTYSNRIWLNTVTSYDENFVEDQLNRTDDFWPSHGDLIDEDTYDSESDGWRVEKISKLDINESRIKKTPILENRKFRDDEIKQLQKMKMIIEERLRILSS